MARPRLNIDPKLVQDLASIGLYPEQIEKVLKIKIDKKLLALAYAKSFDSEFNFLKKAKNGKVHNVKTKLVQTIKMQIADMITRELGPLEILLGYTIDELAIHLESQFMPGMTWEKRSEWHIDHIKPRSAFKSNQIREAFALKNLRPMWAKDNLKKGKTWLDQKKISTKI